ncbi:MAG TPA: DUF4388 domain-containing protein [Nitrospirota bacterium]|nr:DUF4388 domain-containing protein [Nitrospirota bacterium]
MPSFPLSGKIQSTPLPVILESLQKEKATGTLVVRLRNVEKCIHIKDGQIIFAMSTDKLDRLGETLVREGMLSREKMEAALKLHSKGVGFKKLGAVLVENGFLSPKDLFSGLKIQVKNIIYSLFLWEDAEYRFEERLPADIIKLQINLQDLLVEIIKRMKREA